MGKINRVDNRLFIRFNDVNLRDFMGYKRTYGRGKCKHHNINVNLNRFSILVCSPAYISHEVLISIHVNGMNNICLSPIYSCLLKWIIFYLYILVYNIFFLSGILNNMLLDGPVKHWLFKKQEVKLFCTSPFNYYMAPYTKNPY
jgi:hypothetical protein